MSPDKITVTKPQAVEWTMRTDIHRNRQTGVSGSTEPGRKKGTCMKKRFGFKALVTAILLASSAALLLAAGPLSIQGTQADLEAVPQTLTIDGQRFGSDPLSGVHHREPRGRERPSPSLVVHKVTSTAKNGGCERNT